jgi:hypothetical protein
MASKYSLANPNLKNDQNVGSLQIRGHSQKMNIIWIADERETVNSGTPLKR